jgi:LacI family transcriptional regulator
MKKPEKCKIITVYMQTFAKVSGSMSISIKDIARELQISASTVSRALNGAYGVSEKTRQLVLAKAQEMGYVPNLGAKELVNRRSNLIGIIIPETDFEVRPAFFETFPYITKTLRLYGKDTIILSFPPGSYNQGELQRSCIARNLEGVIVMPGFLEKHPILEEILRIKLPAVVMEENTLGPHCSNIGTDEVLGAYTAVDHLIRLGHRRIGFVNGPMSMVSICKERYAGYRKALEDNGIPYDEQRVINSDFTGTGGAKAARLLLERDPSLTAIFFANDLMAMGAISSLQREGIRVPEELSVMGYDGLFVGEYMNPPLSTIQANDAQIGINAAEMMIELINGQRGKSKRIRPSLINRGSTRKIDR